MKISIAVGLVVFVGVSVLLYLLVNQWHVAWRWCAGDVCSSGIEMGPIFFMAGLAGLITFGVTWVGRSLLGKTHPNFLRGSK